MSDLRQRQRGASAERASSAEPVGGWAIGRKTPRGLASPRSAAPAEQIQRWLRETGVSVPLSVMTAEDLKGVLVMIQLRLEDAERSREKIAAALTMLECDMCGAVSAWEQP